MTKAELNHKTECEQYRKEIERLLAENTRLKKEKSELLVNLEGYDRTVRYLQGQVKAYEFAISKGVKKECQ